MAARNRFPMPTGDMPPNPWKYDYWEHMHESVYYKVDEVNDPFCFKIGGQDVRMRVGYYEEDPRWMRISFDNRAGQEVFELTEYVQGAYAERGMVNPTAYVPRYAGLCHDQCEGAPEGLFEQLQERHLCVPVYGDTGRISARGNQWDLLLPEYVFDEDALVLYDPEGMQAYDTQLAAFDTALSRWAGSERTFAYAIWNHYNPDLKKMFGWPAADEYIGPGRDLENPRAGINVYVDNRVLMETMERGFVANRPRLMSRQELFSYRDVVADVPYNPLLDGRERVVGGSVDVQSDLSQIDGWNQLPGDDW